MGKNYRRFIGLAVVFVIIGMPLFSYLFLRNGLTFRINALDALEISDTDEALTKELSKTYSIVPGLVNVLMDANSIAPNRVSQIFEKYKGHKYFHLSTIGKSGSIDSHKYRNLEESPALMKIIDDIDMILIDTSGRVRESYTYSEESFKDFIQHLTVLLPVEPSKKIKLDRDNQ